MYGMDRDNISKHEEERGIIIYVSITTKSSCVFG